MLNSNQIAEAIAVLGLSCASVAAPVSALLQQMEDEQEARPEEDFAAKIADAQGYPTGGASSWRPSPDLHYVTSSQVEASSSPADGYDHPLTEAHPEHSEWCAASQILRQLEAQGTQEGVEP